MTTPMKINICSECGATEGDFISEVMCMACYKKVLSFGKVNLGEISIGFKVSNEYGCVVYHQVRLEFAVPVQDEADAMRIFESLQLKEIPYATQ